MNLPNLCKFGNIMYFSIVKHVKDITLTSGILIKDTISVSSIQIFESIGDGNNTETTSPSFVFPLYLLFKLTFPIARIFWIKYFLDMRKLSLLMFFHINKKEAI